MNLTASTNFTHAWQLHFDAGFSNVSEALGRKMVLTGLESAGLTEITSGLEAGEIVVVSGTYLLHSEYGFKRGSDPMEGHNH